MSEYSKAFRFLGRVEGNLCYWKAKKGDPKQLLDSIMEAYEELFPEDQEKFWEKVAELSQNQSSTTKEE